MSSYTQRMVQLNDHVLIEYRYTSLVSPETFNYNFTRIVNTNMGGTVQLINVDAATDYTGNVRERAAVQTSNGKFTDLDKDQVPDWLTYAASLNQLSTSSVNGANVPYDCVRVHLVSGYNFEDKDGMIIQIAAKERTGSFLQLANAVFLKDSDFFQYNARPMWLGEKLYDRYFDLKVPSVKIINDDYYALEGSPSQVNTFVAKITSNGKGFLRAAPLNITAIDISSTSTLFVGGARYKQYNIGTSKTITLNQSDEFALLSAVVQPSPAGDYFEYFASWAGGFIEDFISNANAFPGYNYIVLHEIRIFEQVGSAFVQTDVLQTIQESDYDKPRKFRPILENADQAVSFTLEYTVRLLNKADSSQIIRTANYTSYNPKEWGKKIQKLKLLNEPEPYIIYNKVVAGPTFKNEAFVNTVPEVMPFTTKYVPSFFDRFSVNIHHESVIMDKNGQLVTDKTSTTTTVYGQGDCSIIVNPFDNFFKFTILQTNGTETPSPLDLGGSASYYLVFINNQGKKVRFPSLADPLLADPSKGDVLFKVPESDAESIVKFTTNQFYIVSKFDTGVEAQIYQGTFNLPANIQAVKTANEGIKTSQNTAIENKLSGIESKQADLQSQADTIKQQTPSAQANTVATQVEIPGASSTVPTNNMNSVVSSILPASETNQ